MALSRETCLAVAVIVALAALFGQLARPVPVDAAPSFPSTGHFSLRSDEPFERVLGSFTKDRLKDGRRVMRGMYWTITRSFTKWAQWARRLLPFALIALIAALADRSLVAAWRSEGLRVLVTYAPLMLYVYARLLFSRQVRIAGKLFLVLALCYGVKRRDLIVDRTVIPGMVDDAILIVIATRVFLSTCSERLVSAFAEQAYGWRRRVTTLQRARQR
jgi:uncharacterized membrane protein YkvA (DUF1232 family)